MKKIKSVTTKILTKNTGIEHTAAYSEFDINGNEIIASDKDYDGTENAKTVSYYNDNNQKVKMEIFTVGELSETHDFKYFEEGKINSEVISYADGSVSTKTYEYQDHKTIITTVDEDGEQEEQEILITDNEENIIEKIIIDNEKNIILHQKAEYTNKKISKRYDYDQSNNETNHRIFLYTPTGLISNVKIFNSKNEIIDFSTYSYDEKKRETLRTIGSRAKTETVYNDDELTVIQTTSTTSGQILGRIITTFDEDKNPITEEDFATIKKFEYKYFQCE